MVGLIVSALGIRLSTLSIENGKTIRTATMPQSRTLAHFGALFRQSRSSKTASTTQPAEILVLTILRKSSVISLPPSDAVDHLLHLVKLIAR